MRTCVYGRYAPGMALHMLGVVLSKALECDLVRFACFWSIFDSIFS